MGDVPDELWSEDFLFAMLLNVIIEACATMKDGELKSWHRSAYADALRLLSGAAFVEIQSDVDDQIVAQVTPLGKRLIERLHQG